MMVVVFIRGVVMVVSLVRCGVWGVSFLLVGKIGSVVLAGCKVGGVCMRFWRWWVLCLVGGVFKFFLFFLGLVRFEGDSRVPLLV